jgi:Tol biopolymer transport system component
MPSISSQDSMSRPSRSLLPRRLALAAALALSACDGGESPLAPADTPTAPTEQTLAPAGQPGAPDLALATTAQRILFTSTRAGGYDIFRMDPLGYNVARLTSFGYYASEPAWSYGNTRIAMIRPRKDASNVEHADIYLMNADGTNKHWARAQPSSFDIRFPSWSPDGVHLAVAVIIGGKPYLAQMDAGTGYLAFVPHAGKVIQGNYPSYDPTGKRILYVDGTGKIIELIDITTDTGYWMVTSQTIMGYPRFSPDGTKIAFSKVVGSNIDVYVWNKYGNSVTRLTSDPAYDGVPTWSRDGSRIAFESNRTGKSQIWVMNAATGGSLTRITHTATDEKYPAWSH